MKNVLIIARIPFGKVRYDQVIDHNTCDVTYLGTPQELSSVPMDLRCQKIEVERDARGSLTRVCEALQKHKNLEGWKAIIAKSEYDLQLAAGLRALLNIPGPSVEEVNLMRDKVKMKENVEKSGIRVPKFLDGSEARSHASLNKFWNGPTIYKPKSGASSEGVLKFESLNDALDRAFAEPRLSEGGEDFWEVEEWIEAPILHFDGVVSRGKVTHLVASQYVNSCLDYSNGKPLGSFQFDTSRSHKIWVETCLNALRHANGAFHIEAFDTENGLVFLEAARRVGGADVAETFYLKTGNNIHHEDLREICGRYYPNLDLLDESPTSQTSTGYFGWFLFPANLQSAFSLPTRPNKLEGVEILEWKKDESKLRAKGLVTYQSDEVPLAGRIRADNPELLKDFLRKLFR
jgi:hypothetical protein